MAEIKIEKKKPIWPWIILAIIILALLYFFVLNNDDDGINDTSNNTIEMTTESSLDNNTNLLSEKATTEISDYTTYISDDSKMGIDHEYSNNALIKLIDATEAVANSLGINIRADLELARNNASSITEDPLEVDHADKIRNAGTIIVKAIGQIQTQKFPDLENNVSELKNLVMNIDPKAKTLNQKTEVKSFFEKASNVLMNMKNR